MREKEALCKNLLKVDKSVPLCLELSETVQKSTLTLEVTEHNANEAN